MTSKYNTEGRSLKDFPNYQNQIKLFKNLRDSNINPKKVLKDQINLKSDLDKIRKGNSKSKSKDQISVKQNADFFYLREKIIDFLEIIIIIFYFYFYFYFFFFLLSETKYKTKYGEGKKILTPKLML